MAQRILAATVGLLLAACGGISQMGATAGQGGDEIVDAGAGGTKTTGGSKNQGGTKTTGGWMGGGGSPAGGWTAVGGSTNYGANDSVCSLVGCAPLNCCECSWGAQCSAASCSATCGGYDDWVMPICAGYPQADPVTGCMMRQAGDDAGLYSDVSRTVQGTVRAVAYYVPAGGCLASLLPAGEGSARAGRPIAMVVVDGAGTAWDVEYYMPGGVSPLYVGDPVTVTYQYKFGGWSPSIRRLVVSRSGTTIVYVLQGGSPTDAPDAPVKLSPGEAECTTTDTCGTWQKQQLFAWAPNGASASLATGGTAFLWPYYIANGGLYATTSYSSTCADWYVQGFSVGITNGPLGAE
jgi:hypothetical protein